jgi:hypothetical protein
LTEVKNILIYSRYKTNLKINNKKTSSQNLRFFLIVRITSVVSAGFQVVRLVVFFDQIVVAGVSDHFVGLVVSENQIADSVGSVVD